MWYCGNSNDALASNIKQLFEEKIPGLFISGYFAYTVKVRNNQLLAAALYRNYNGSNIEIHLQAENHFDRACIKAALSFPFKVLRCNRLTAIIEINNNRMRSIVEKLGFEKECTLKNFYGLDRDADMYRLDRHKAEKWIK